MIPEGTYLEMCDNLKRVHDTLPKPNKVPFMPVVRPIVVDSESESESESESDDETWFPDEWTQNENAVRLLMNDLKNVESRLKKLKPIQRITKKVREDAMKHFVSARATTFEDYVRLTDWSGVSEQRRKELTSKKFERKLYEDYKRLENNRIEGKKCEAVELKRNLEIDIIRLRERQAYLQRHYNL
jgi:hypothetical protein